jgi:hypothetical protein
MCDLKTTITTLQLSELHISRKVVISLHCDTKLLCELSALNICSFFVVCVCVWHVDETKQLHTEHRTAPVSLSPHSKGS